MGDGWDAQLADAFRDCPETRALVRAAADAPYVELKAKLAEPPRVPARATSAPTMAKRGLGDTATSLRP